MSSYKKKNQVAFVIRTACAEDASFLPGIERSAAQLFRQIPSLSWIADDAVLPEETHLACMRAGTCWVATDEKDHPTGFLSARICKKDLHILEMSVSRKKQGRGIGKALLHNACTWAKGHQMESVTLTTFQELPWNAPFYARMGFERLPDSSLNARLAFLLREEMENGFPVGTRCAMRLDLESFHPF